MSTDPNEPDAGDVFLVVTNQKRKAFSSLRDSTSGAWSAFAALAPAGGWKSIGAAVPVTGITTDRPPRLLQLLGTVVEPAPKTPVLQAAAGGSLAHPYYSVVMALRSGYELPLYVVLAEPGPPIVALGDQVPVIGAGDWDETNPLTAISLEWQLVPQLAVVSAAGELFHTLQTGLIGEAPPPAEPKWTGFADARAAVGFSGQVTSAACTHDVNGYQLFFIDTTGHLYQITKPYASGSTFGSLVDLSGFVGPFTGVPTQLAAKHYNGDFGSGGFFHLAVVTSLGKLYHLASPPGGGPGWTTEDVQAKAGAIGKATSVAIDVQLWLGG